MRPLLLLNHHHRLSRHAPLLRRTTSHPIYSTSFLSFQLRRSSTQRKLRNRLLRCRNVKVRAFGEDIGDFAFDDFGDNDVGGGPGGYVMSSSDGEHSDGEFVLSPLTDMDLPTVRVSANDAINVTAHRLGMIGRGRKRNRSRSGILTALPLMAFVIVILLFLDSYAWKIVRLPLTPFYLCRPFFTSLALVSIAGYVCIPLLNDLKIYQAVTKQWPLRNPKRTATPTLGGVFFIPVGLGVALFLAGFSSVEVLGAVASTLAFSVIGLLDDSLSVINHRNGGLSAPMKFSLEVAVVIGFSFWLTSTSIKSPYSMKLLVPLPSPVGLIFLGKYYLLLTSFCFLSLGNGISLTDRVDGLNSGIAALAFLGLSIAVLPLCSELAIFGVSMSGACIGFLLHNRYKASVVMGHTGSLALGGALTAMAACTGMFFPLFISSGIFLLDGLSVIFQVLYVKMTKRFRGGWWYLFPMVTFHNHLLLRGFRTPTIVAGAYVLSCMLALIAGYVGLISA